METLAKFLCCPHCYGEINITDTNLTCSNCKQNWSIDSDGVIQILDDDYSFSADREGMNKLLGELRNMSQEQLVANVLRLESSYSDFQYNYCLNSARADWTVLGNFSNKIVLDLGCGYGSVSIPLAQQRAKAVICVDATLERIKFCSIIAKMKNVKNIIPIHGDVTKLPLKLGSIDRIIMVGLLEYSSGFSFSDNLSPKQKQIKFLKYLHDLLSDNGELWVGIENQLSPIHFLGGTYHGEMPFTPLLPKSFANIIHKIIRKKPYETYLWTRGGYYGLFKEADFKNTEFYYAFPRYDTPSFIASSDKNEIISQYLDKLGGNSMKVQIGLTLVKLMDKAKLAGLFSPSFFIKAEK